MTHLEKSGFLWVENNLELRYSNKRNNKKITMGRETRKNHLEMNRKCGALQYIL